MLKRYTLPDMEALWSDESKFRRWLAVEILICEGWHRLGLVPGEALEKIRRNAAFTVAGIELIEKRTGHDLAAFLDDVSSRLGEEARYLHYGVTSSDVVDTALSVAMTEALDLLVAGAQALSSVLEARALEHRSTLTAGRTHGVHAEPTTLGLKLLVWHFEMERNVKRLGHVREEIAVGKISGAVGTYATVEPAVEEHVCRSLGLARAPASTQVLQRDRHASLLSTLAIIAGTVEKIATEFRHLQRTEVLEAQEHFGAGRKGSSAMPHKRNPVNFEQICGLCRVIRGNAAPGLENIALWHERDISHSSVERIVIPDSTTLAHYVLSHLADHVARATFFPERMRANLESTRGLLFSQRVLLALVEAGMSRMDAYDLVQRNAAAAWDEGKDFRDEVRAEARVRELLTPESLDGLFDYGYYLRHVDEIFERRR